MPEGPVYEPGARVRVGSTGEPGTVEERWFGGTGFSVPGDWHYTVAMDAGHTMTCPASVLQPMDDGEAR